MCNRSRTNPFGRISWCSDEFHDDDQHCHENGATKQQAADVVRPVWFWQVHAAAETIRRVPGQVRVLGVSHNPVPQMLRSGRPALPFHHQGVDAGGHRPRRIPRARRFLQQHVWHQVQCL